MVDLAAIRKRLSNENPVINKNVDGVDIPISDGERELLLDEWVKNAVDTWNHRLRSERDALLIASDWTQVSDAPVDAKAWAEYRQALRDLPANTDDPENPVWPTPPA